MILNVEEKQGGIFQEDPFRDKLENTIEIHNLMDILPKNGKYTLSNKRLGMGNIKEQLDIFLIQDSIITDYKVVTSNIIPSAALDHKHIIIKVKESEKLGPLPFRYNPLWDNHEEVRTLISTMLNQNINGSLSFVWESKLKNIKRLGWIAL